MASASTLPVPPGVLASLLEHLTFSRLVLCGSIFTITAFAIDVLSQPWYPSSIPAVGHGRGPLAWWRNATAYIIHHQKWVQQGYEQYSLHGRAFILPSSAFRPPDIVLPRSQTSWLLDQPETVVSATDAHNHILHGWYNFLGARIANDAFHTKVVHRHLVRHLASLIPDMAQEAQGSVEDAFTRGRGQKPANPARTNGSEEKPDTGQEGWRELNLWDAFLHVVPRVTNRMLVGSPICQDPVFLEAMVAIADTTVRNCFILATIPRILHPVIGRLLAVPNYRLWRKAHGVVGPLIEGRLRDMVAKHANKPSHEHYKPPEDFITWTVRQALAENNPLELDAETISKRLVPVEFASIHTTVLTMHSLILDILSSPDAQAIMSTISKEAQSVLGASPHKAWDKTCLLSLYHADSAIRESMRLSNFHSTLVERLVVSPHGLSNPFEGWTAPQGSWITLNLTGLHHDDALHENARKYDAFRFARTRERPEQSGDDDGTDGTLKLKRLGMVATSDSHLAFGHGRHACPGRFFVAHEIKIILAQLFTNYDIQSLDERPKPMWIGATIVPPLDVKVSLRRRVVDGV